MGSGVRAENAMAASAFFRREARVRASEKRLPKKIEVARQPIAYRCHVASLVAIADRYSCDDRSQHHGGMLESLA
jgi:hypothetical protein